MTNRTDNVGNADIAPQAPSRRAIGQVPWRRSALVGLFAIASVVAIGGWIWFLGWLTLTLAAWIVG
jgi:hypothetical protein